MQSQPSAVPWGSCCSRPYSMFLSLSFPFSVFKVPGGTSLIPAPGLTSDCSTTTWAVERGACGSQQPNESRPWTSGEMKGYPCSRCKAGGRETWRGCLRIKEPQTPEKPLQYNLETWIKQCLKQDNIWGSVMSLSRLFSLSTHGMSFCHFQPKEHCWVPLNNISTRPSQPPRPLALDLDTMLPEPCLIEHGAVLTPASTYT